MVQKLLLLIITLLMLVAGFWQKGGSAVHRPLWLDGGHGLRFSGQSFAYAEQFPILNEQESAQESAGVVINLSIKPDFLPTPKFGTILELFDRFDQQRIVIAQWDKSLVVLNNEDFSNRAKQPKIYARLPQDDQVHDISIQSDQKGTRVYIDGRLVGQNGKLLLRVPQQPTKSYIVLGNGVRARTPWTGNLYALSISQLDLVGDGQQSTSRPLMIYKFDEGEGVLIRDYSSNMVNLSIPEKPVILLVSVLDVPSYVQLQEPWMKRDLVMNFLGFIPFGFLLARLLLGASDNSPATALLLSFLISFLFSLSIELTQVLLPQRTSSMVDLVLNSIGGLCGAVLALLLRLLSIRFRRKSA